MLTANQLMAIANTLPQNERAQFLADAAALSNSVSQSAVNTADLSAGTVTRKVAIADTDAYKDQQFEVIFDNTSGTSAIDVVVFDWLGRYDNPSNTKPTSGTFGSTTATYVSKFTAARNVVISKIEIESVTKASLGTMVQNWKYSNARLDDDAAPQQPIRFVFPTNQDPNLVLTGTYNSDNLVISGISALTGKVAAGDVVTLRFYVSAVQQAFIGNA